MAAAGGSAGRTTEMARPSKRRDCDDPFLCLCPRVAPLGRGAEINKPFSHEDVQQGGWRQFQVMTVRPCWLSGGELRTSSSYKVLLLRKCGFVH